MVDLAGLAWSLPYVPETRALGLLWLDDRFGGSNAAAVEARGLENCADLAKAWVLIEPDGPIILTKPASWLALGLGRRTTSPPLRSISPSSTGGLHMLGSFCSSPYAPSRWRSNPAVNSGDNGRKWSQ
ncbi:hypothetical protein [Bradyrhizobium sp. JR3.5]